MKLLLECMALLPCVAASLMMVACHAKRVPVAYAPASSSSARHGPPSTRRVQQPARSVTLSTLPPSSF